MTSMKSQWTFNEIFKKDVAYNIKPQKTRASPSL